MAATASARCRWALGLVVSSVPVPSVAAAVDGVEHGHSGATTSAEPTVTRVPAPPQNAAPQASSPRPSDLTFRLDSLVRADGEESSYGMQLRRARLALNVRPRTWLAAQVDLDVADTSMLRDAFLKARAAPWLAVTVGQLKKPFSRIETTPSHRLPVWRRGLTNKHVVEGLGFGGRDRGVVLSGKLASWGYAAGAFNGSGRVDDVDTGKDASMRLTYRPDRRLRLGVSGSMKYRNASGIRWARHDVWAAGLDGSVRLDPIEVVGEAIWAQSAVADEGAQVLGAMIYAMARVRVAPRVQIRPLVKLEVLDDDLAGRDDRALAVTVGGNLRFGKLFQIMLQAEQVNRQAGSTVPSERLLIAQISLYHTLVLGTL